MLINDGMFGVILPHGTLSRAGREGQIRQNMLEDIVVEAVVDLAPNLFYGNGIPACVLQPRQARRPQGPRALRPRAEAFAEGTNQNLLSDENVARPVDASHPFRDEERFSRVAQLEEIAENDYTLNITRYIDTTQPEEPIDVAVEKGYRDETL